MALLDLDALRRAPVTREPFAFTVVPNFVGPVNAEAVRADFPHIGYPGLLPVEATKYGPKFAELIEELQSEPAARTFSETFDIDLTGRSTMITVRGRCQPKDGRIHTDSTAKLVTALLYFNDGWEAEGGRVRLLRRPDGLNDIIAKVPPVSGTLIFIPGENTWHGWHRRPIVGVRRSLIVNYVRPEWRSRHELAFPDQPVRG